MKKQLLAAAAVTTIGVAGVATAGVSHALTSSTDTNPTTSLAEAIAKKFNLKAADVETVIKDQRTAMGQEHEAKIAAKITQLVKDGKLTQAQADAINAKRAELQKEHESHKLSKTEDQAARKAAMEKRKADLENWAKQHNIPSEYVRYVMGGHEGHGMRGGAAQ